MRAPKYFRLRDGRAEKLTAHAAGLERDIQNIFEADLEPLLGVRLLASEYSFPGGRMDTLGLDKRNRLVVIEYKRHSAPKIIQQARAYAKFLEQNPQESYRLVKRKLGDDDFGSFVEHANPKDVRRICIANEFTEENRALFEESKNIELVLYQLLRRDGMEDEILTLEWVPNKAPDGILPAPSRDTKPPKRSKGEINYKPMKKVSGEQKARLDALLAFFRSLGSDVEFEEKKKYCKVMHQPPRAFATFVLTNSEEKIAIGVHFDLNQVEVIEGFPEDVSGITPAGKNLGGGRKVNYRINIRSDKNLERAKPLLRRAYEEAKR